MTISRKCIGLVMCGTLFVVWQGFAGETRPTSLEQLLPNVKELVQKFYPNAQVSLQKKGAIYDEPCIHFEFKTRKFTIHKATMDGYWQDPRDEIGPQRDGIFGEIYLRSGLYDGQASVPQDFKVAYYNKLLMAPESAKYKNHLEIHLRYPSNVSQKFYREFRHLMNQFNEEYDAETNHPAIGELWMLPGYDTELIKGSDPPAMEIKNKHGLSIRMEVGANAWAFSSDGEETMRKATWHRRQALGRQSFEAAMTDQKTLIVRFPRNHTVFTAKINSEQDVADVLLIALAYRDPTIPY